MPRLFKMFFLEPNDIGMQKHSEKEVASLMTQKSLDRDESLKEFAILISTVFDEPASLTSISSGLDKSRR